MKKTFIMLSVIIALLLCACGEAAPTETATVAAVLTPTNTLDVGGDLSSEKPKMVQSYANYAKSQNLQLQQVKVSLYAEGALSEGTTSANTHTIHIGDMDFTVINQNLPYDEVRDFSDGAAVVGNSVGDSIYLKKYGMIDSKGNLIADLKYDYIMDVREGMAVFGMDTDNNYKTGDSRGGYGIDKYGFLNAKGEEVVPPIYDFVGYFSEGLAVVINYSERYVSSYTEGLPTYKKDTYLGFIDKNGELAIPMEYESCANIEDGASKTPGFSEGLAVVRKDGKSGAIDKNGNVIIPFTFNNLNSFHDGLASFTDGPGVVPVENGPLIFTNDAVNCGFINKNGDVVISGYFGKQFYNGVCIVSNGSSLSKYGLIDKEGTLLTPLQYEQINSFSEGMACVKINDGTNVNYGFIDTTGKLAFSIACYVASDFSNGLSRIGLEDERIGNGQKIYGYVDKTGNYVIPPKFSSAPLFKNGTAHVEIGTPTVINSNWRYDVILQKLKELGIEARNFYIDLSGNEITWDEMAIIQMKNNGSPYYIYTDAVTGEKVLIENSFYSETTTNSTANPELKIASATNARILVNGKSIDFEAYNINNNNYFKLRDLAYVLNGTEKQFEVTWDATRNAINLISYQAYTSVGGEMAAGDGTEKTATPTASTIYKDGRQITLTAYNIGGNNYFKLRDIGKAFDFDVSWNGENNTIVVETAKSYTDD